MRIRPALAAAALAVLLACPDSKDSSPPGNPDGAACTAATECQSGLCSSHLCTAVPPPVSCAPPRIVLGPAIDVPDPGVCVIPGPVAALGYVDLGEHGAGELLSFHVPANTASFTILSQAVPNATDEFITFQGFLIPNGVVPTRVVAPPGALFFDDAAALPRIGFYNDVTLPLAYYGGVTPLVGAFTVPNTAAGLDFVLSAGSLPEGDWQFTVNDFALECRSVPGCVPQSNVAGRYRVQVLLEPRKPSGTLDLEVYLATGILSDTMPDAATVAANPQFARWAQSFGSYFAQAGICLGDITVHDLPDWVTSGGGLAPDGILDISGAARSDPPRAQPRFGCDFLSQLFTLGVAQKRAVHVFFAEALVEQNPLGGGFAVLGVDGSIPGPSGAPGTLSGGAVVGVFDLLGAERAPGACTAGGAPDVGACGTDLLAYVSAHEAGHWLGLYHTTEAEGVTFDPLSDTATCACLQCAPFGLRARCAERSTGVPTVMLASYCAGRPRCGGSRDLMFWLVDDRFATGQLTRQQGDVMRQNPAVR